MIMQNQNTEKRYVDLLKDVINKHCVSMKKRLQRFPQKIVKELPKLNIPDGEVMVSDGKEYKLKAKANDCALLYDKLMAQASPSNYSNFLKNFKTACRGKSPELIKTIFNDFQSQLVKDFSEQKKALYEAVTTMSAVVRWLKKDNKEKIKKNSDINKDETPTPESNLTIDANSAGVDNVDIAQSKKEDPSIVPVGTEKNYKDPNNIPPSNESVDLEEFESWMKPFMESMVSTNHSFDPDYL